MGLIVSITLVLGLIFYWEGRRLYKEPEEHSKLQRIAITIKLGGISYLKSVSYTHLDVYKRQVHL